MYAHIACALLKRPRPFAEPARMTAESRSITDTAAQQMQAVNLTVGRV